MLMPERKKLGEILVDLRVLTPAEVDRVLHALRRRGGNAKFGRVAREMGLLREEHILAALAVQMQMFPRIGELSLNRLLDRLQDPEAPLAPVGRRRGM
jgi:hypothetical protein